VSVSSFAHPPVFLTTLVFTPKAIMVVAPPILRECVVKKQTSKPKAVAMVFSASETILFVKIKRPMRPLAPN
jgi:hypothetical protein